MKPKPLFKRLRFNKDHHLGMGDIRLTRGQQDALENTFEAKEKKIEELKEYLQIKKLADSPIIAMIDNKPVHQDEYEALKKELKEALNIIKDF